MTKRISVVTGGASGIGAACVRLLLERGDEVAIIDLEAALAGGSPVAGARPYACDVQDEAAVRRVAATIAADMGPVGLLVNSAGIIQRPLPPQELSMADWDRVVAVDQRGTYVCCVAFGSAMARSGGGCIVNIASIAGSRSMPLHAYGPAKAAVLAMTECLAVEWGRAGVRVNAVSPGYTLTPALRQAIDAGERDPAQLAAQTALGRLVDPEHVARAVLFLGSDAAEVITGINLPVDAGWLVGTSWQTYGGVRGHRA
jgi:NAD(P)-dependent dehydrogenase (short-subunit alcohol dehydrogenase family)